MCMKHYENGYETFLTTDTPQHLKDEKKRDKIEFVILSKKREANRDIDSQKLLGNDVITLWIKQQQLFFQSFKFYATFVHSENRWNILHKTHDILGPNPYIFPPYYKLGSYQSSLVQSIASLDLIGQDYASSSGVISQVDPLFLFL